MFVGVGLPKSNKSKKGGGGPSFGHFVIISILNPCKVLNIFWRRKVIKIEQVQTRGEGGPNFSHFMIM